jgi:hypothetical protein
MPIEHRVREALDAYMARVRHDMDAHLRSLTSDLMRLLSDQQEYWRSDIERSVAEARTDAERTFRARLESARDELTRELDLRLSRERADLVAQHEKLQAERAALHAAVPTVQAPPPAPPPVDPRESRMDTMERLMRSVRRIDEADSLSGILEALAQGAAAETSRVAILLVDGDLLKVWGHRGFVQGEGPIEMPVSATGTLAAAVALRQTSFVPPLIEGREQSVPIFMRVPVGHTGLIVPLVVGGECVALLYADDVNRTPQQEDAPIWTEEVDLLARHASLRLENITSVRTVEVLARPS